MTHENTINGWIKAEDAQPAFIEGKEYSKNVLAVVDGELKVMNYFYLNDDDNSGFAWANCYGIIDGDAEFDDQYEVTHWQHFPELP